jgi:hypothetical protein
VNNCKLQTPKPGGIKLFQKYERNEVRKRRIWEVGDFQILLSTNGVINCKSQKHNSNMAV